MQKISSTKGNFVNWIRDFFSIKEVFTLRNTVVMGMMLAMSVVLDQFSLYITPTFKAISFAYLPGVIVAVLFGPWAAIVFGFVYDTIKFVVNSHGGAYFPGYALSEMVTFFIYACFLYKRPIKVWRVACARILFLITVVFGLNFIWQAMMLGKTAGGYFTGVRLINNLVQLPFHVALTALIVNYIFKLKLINKFNRKVKNVNSAATESSSHTRDGDFS